MEDKKNGNWVGHTKTESEDIWKFAGGKIISEFADVLFRTSWMY